MEYNSLIKLLWILEALYKSSQINSIKNFRKPFKNQKVVKKLPLKIKMKLIRVINKTSNIIVIILINEGFDRKSIQAF